MLTYTFSGKEDRITAEHLQNGETCYVLGIGNSMTPILKSKQAVICTPVKDDTVLKKRDIVLSKVKGHYYLHLIHPIKNNGDLFLIGNNHGHMNGWVCFLGYIIYIFMKKIIKHYLNINELYVKSIENKTIPE